MNKNISIWRGSNPPPTNYHIWVKDSGELFLKIEDEWSIISDPNIENTLKNYVDTELSTSNESLKTLLNQGDNTLKNYIDNKQLSSLILNGIDLNNKAEIETINASFDTNNIQFYQIKSNGTSFPELFRNQQNPDITKGQICHFYKEDLEFEDGLKGINVDTTINFNNSFYHLVFGENDNYKTYAIDDINGVCKSNNPEFKDSQLWEFIGDASSFYIRSKQGKYIYHDGQQYKTRSSEGDLFKMEISPLGWQNYYVIYRVNNPSESLNIRSGIYYNQDIVDWENFNDVGNQIGIIKFQIPNFSNSFIENQYCIHFDNNGLNNLVFGDPQVPNGQIKAIESTNHVLQSRWKFIGTVNNFQLQHCYTNKFLSFNGSRIIAQDGVDAYGFKLNVSYKSGKQYFQIGYNNSSYEGKVIYARDGLVNNSVLDFNSSQTDRGTLTFNLVKSVSLQCVVISQKQQEYFRNYPMVQNSTSTVLLPNIFYVWDNVSTLNITLGMQIPNITNEYLFQFTSGSTATQLNLPQHIKWANGVPPYIEANKTYQISILNNLGSIMEFY